MNYTCPECKTTHTAQEWNRTTEEYYGEEIVSIESDDKDSSWFTCPHCGKETFYSSLIGSDTITISKQEYESLLEYKAVYEGLCK